MLNPLRDGSNFGSRIGAIARCPMDPISNIVKQRHEHVVDYSYADFFTAGTGTPAIFTLTEKSVLLVVK